MALFDAIEDFIFSRRNDAPTLAQETPPPVIRPAAIAPATTMSMPLEAPSLMPLLDRVDVEAILDREAARHPARLDWRDKAADLMKLCGLEAGIAARKALAHELGHRGTGEASDAWLLKTVMHRLADDGAEVPADFR